MGSAQEVTKIILGWLELVVAVAALALLLALLVSLARSTLRALFGSVTFVYPFIGTDPASTVSTILTHRLGEVEREYLDLGKRLRTKIASFEAGQQIQKAAGGARADAFVAERTHTFVKDNPMQGLPVQSIGLLGVTVSPAALLSLVYSVRRALAPRGVRGTVHAAGATVRITPEVVKSRSSSSFCLSKVGPAEKLLDLIDDVAFDIVRHRIQEYTPQDVARGVEDPHADTWAGYREFQQGYLDHLEFLKTGRQKARESAVDHYRDAIAYESDHHLAHYNLGLLLYARYTAVDNLEAIRHFETACGCEKAEIRALALAAKTWAYGQQVHRYGQTASPEPWVARADHASQEALRAVEELPEAHRPLAEVYFARGWAFQIRGDVSAALIWYQRTADLPSVDHPVEQQMQMRIKSFALTNAGWLTMSRRGDLQAAESLFRTALAANRFNQMTHANLGEVHARRGDYASAIADYHEALEVEPLYYKAMNELALVYLAMAHQAADAGDQSKVEQCVADAKHWHGKALWLLPDDSEADRRTFRGQFETALVDIMPPGGRVAGSGTVTPPASDPASTGTAQRPSPRLSR